jgi:glutathione S-transferase
MATRHAEPLVVSAFNWVPDFARGNVRDLRVRWALEEIGRPYGTALLDATRPRGADYTSWQPFGQVPALREGDLSIFESGAILLYLGEDEERLLPREQQARWQAVSWLIAALNSVEPSLSTLIDLRLFHREEPWAAAAFDTLRSEPDKRLAQLSGALGDRDWLAGPFSAADIAMVTVLRLADAIDLLGPHPNLSAYVARGTVRPAYARALQAQLDDFEDNPPGPQQAGPRQGE